MSSQIPFDRHSQKFKFTRVPNAKYATVRKSLKVPKGSSQTHEELLLSVDKENWTDGGIKIGFTEPLEFSLNKKCRWELLEEFRSNLANWNSLNHQRCVSAVERIIPFGWTNKTRLGIQPKWYKRQNEMKTVSSHQYINGEEYHIAGKQGKYFNLSDKQVIRNAEPPKKLRKKKVATFRRAPESPAIMPEDKDIVGINYELLYPTDSLKLYEKEKKKLAGAKDPDKPYWKAKEVKFKQKYRKYIDFEAASDDFCESDDADSASPVEELVKCQWSLGDFIVEERTKKAKKIINEELVCNEEMFDFPMCSKALMFDVEFGSSGYASNSSNAGSNSRLDSVGEDLITTEDFKPRKFEVMTEEELETFWEQQNYVNQAKVLENVHEISNRSSRRNIAKKERRKARKLVEQNKPKPPEVKITFTPVSNFQPGSKNFQMLPAEVDLPTAQLSHNFLQENFGFGYYEVHAIPRRFCVDISSLVRDGFIRADKRLEVEIICVFEPYKHGENVTKCR